MDRLFRDWRFALLWVIGISAMAAAYFADGGGHEDLLPQPQQAVPQAASAVASPAPSTAPTQPAAERTPGFGEPMLDTTPFEPSPVEPQDAASAAPTEASPPAPPAQ